MVGIAVPIYLHVQVAIDDEQQLHSTINTDADLDFESPRSAKPNLNELDNMREQTFHRTRASAPLPDR